jgi:hypothetical protein
MDRAELKKAMDSKRFEYYERIAKLIADNKEVSLADIRRQHARVAADALGKRSLIAGTERNLCPGNNASRGCVDKIDAERLNLPGEGNGILNGPAALGPV